MSMIYDSYNEECPKCSRIGQGELCKAHREHEALTKVYLTDHGLFVAYTSHVAAKLRLSSKRKMVDDIMGLWPEVFQRAELRGFPSYVLATILTQK